MQPTIAQNFYIFSEILTAPKHNNFACKVTKESDRFAIAIFVGILTVGILTLIAYIFIKCNEGTKLAYFFTQKKAEDTYNPQQRKPTNPSVEAEEAPQGIATSQEPVPRPSASIIESTPFFFHNREKIHLRLFSLTQVLPSSEKFADYEDPISEESVESFIKEGSVSFVCATPDSVVSTRTVALWLSQLPARTKLHYNYPSFWNSSNEFKGLLEFLIKESTGDIKIQLESQLRIFEENLENFQTLETSFNVINILKYLSRVLICKDQDKGAMAAMQYNQIKGAFPNEIGEFFLPGPIFTKEQNYCQKHAGGALFMQTNRLETLLEPSESKCYTEEEFEEKFNRLLEEMQKNYS